MSYKFIIFFLSLGLGSYFNAFGLSSPGIILEGQKESIWLQVDTIPTNLQITQDSTLYQLIDHSIDSTNVQISNISNRLSFLGNIFEVYSGMDSQVARKNEIEREINLKTQQKEILELKLTSLKDLLEQLKVSDTIEEKEIIASRFYALEPTTKEIAVQSKEVKDSTQFSDPAQIIIMNVEDSLEVLVQKSEDYVFEVNTDDVIFDPPDPECAISFEGNDLVTNKYRKDVKIEPFFSYTDPKIRSYFKSGDFLKCEGFISIFGGYNLVNLKIIIASKNAPKTYGSLNRGALLVIKLINGERLYGNNVAPNLGEVEPYTGNTIYRTSYTVNKDALKAMSKYEVDKIGILWSSGYEEYEIYNVDFFIHQIECLNSN